MLENNEHHPPAWEQVAITRTWYLHPLLEKYIVLNMNYHIEHHLFTDLPWHQLNKAHKYLQNDKQKLNVISFYQWMSHQRQRPFADVIKPSKVDTGSQQILFQ